MKMANRMVYIKSNVYEDLLELAKKYPSRIICGFILGYKDNDCFFIDGFHLFPAYVGPKIHFKPIWKGYYDAKEYITKFMHKEIIGEFHTHPDGNKELTDKDKQILKWLGAKIMVLVTPEDIIPIEYISQQKNQPDTYNKLGIDLI
jgi:proteasome lid subunit RPN8/RPN11